MPIDASGYTQWLKTDILQELINQIHNSWTANADLTEQSPTGQFIRGLTQIIQDIDNNIHDTWDNGFLSSSEGSSLDRHSANFGLVRHQAQPAMVNLTITGTAGYIVEEGASFSTATGLEYLTSDDVQLDDNGVGTVLAYSEDTGDEYNVGANTINQIGLGVEEVDTVTNDEPAVGAAADEDDQTFKARIARFEQSGLNPTINGVLNSLYSVDGVRSASVIPNNEGTTDSYGTPPYTLHIYVQGGKPQQIGEAIFTAIAAGKKTAGAQQVKVTDSNGVSHTVAFDYAKPVEVKITLTLNVDPLNYDHNSVLTAVGDSFQNYFDTLAMGSDVIYTKLFGMIYDASDGILDAKVQLHADGEKLNDNGDLVIGNEEVATFDPDIDLKIEGDGYTPPAPDKPTLGTVTANDTSITAELS